jgi:hypothetical protein
MTFKQIAFAISISLLALAGCRAGAHVGVGEKAPSSATQYGTPG